VEALGAADETLEVIEKHVNLLPNFDPFLLGHRDKSLYLDEEDYKKVYRKAGWISAVMLVGGRVAGTWSYIRQGKRLVVEFSLFRPSSLGDETVQEGLPSHLLRKFEEEARDVGNFLGFQEIEVRWPNARLNHVHATPE